MPARSSVQLHKDGQTITVSDNGRGIPVDKHPKTKKPALEMVLTILHAGGKFEGNNYKTAGGLHGVGASVVNALSKKMVAVVRRGGSQYRMEFSKGQTKTKLQKLKGTVRGTGTTITFTPDPTIFPKTDFDPETIRQRLEIASYLPPWCQSHVRRRRQRHQRDVSSRAGNRRLPRESTQRAKRHGHPRDTIHFPRTKGNGSNWRCSGPNRPTSTSAPMSTASQLPAAARTKMDFGPG